jgi:transposase
MEALSGNSIDKKSLVASIEVFVKSLTPVAAPQYFIGDRALYSEANLCCLQSMGGWIRRVPETIAEVNVRSGALFLSIVCVFLFGSYRQYTKSNFAQLLKSIVH